MTPESIAALAAVGESETLEFNATTGTRRESTTTVCAMLNQRGEYELFVITPDGRGVGQQLSERLRVSDDLEVFAVRVNPGTSPRISTGALLTCVSATRRRSCSPKNTIACYSSAYTTSNIGRTNPTMGGPCVIYHIISCIFFQIDPGSFERELSLNRSKTVSDHGGDNRLLGKEKSTS